MLAHRFLLAGGASSDIELAQQPANGPPTGRCSHGQESGGEFSQRQVGPKNADPHGVAAGELLQNLPQILFECRLGLG